MGISNKKQQIKVYYYPSPSRGGYPNPYSYHYKEAIEKEYNLINRENKCAKILGWDFFKNSFKADLYIINWLESICFLRLGWLQYIFACLGLWIIKKRRKKIVWMLALRGDGEVGQYHIHLAGLQVLAAIGRLGGS